MNRRIALVGVPKSGKSALAAAIRKRYLDDGKEVFTEIRVLDGYAEKASERLNMAKGFSGSWYYDIGVSLDRIGLETKAREDGAEVVITCGTVIESASYSMFNFGSRAEFKLEDEKQDEAMRMQASMMTGTCLFRDTFRYDKIYYLNQIEPAEEDASLFQTMDQSIKESFNALQLTTIAKDLTVEGAVSIEDATEKRIELVGEDLYEDTSEGRGEESERAEERGIRTGPEAGSENGGDPD